MGSLMPVAGLIRPRSLDRPVQLKKGRNNEVSALFDSCGNTTVQTTAQAVTGRFTCLTVVAPLLPITSVIPAPE